MTSRILAFPARTGAPRRRSLRARLLGFAAGLTALDRLYRERCYLEELDERALRDIGVSRAEIDAELRRPIDWRAMLFRG